MSEYDLRPVRHDDAARIADIYNHFVSNTAISFEEEIVSPREIVARIDGIVGTGMPWLVAQREGVVLGYAYAAKWRERRAYRFTAECTIYTCPDSDVRGAGSALYGALFPSLRQSGHRSVIAVIALPNPASIALHERFGMKKVAHYSEVGFKFGKWHDVGHWQAMLQA